MTTFRKTFFLIFLFEKKKKVSFVRQLHQNVFFLVLFFPHTFFLVVVFGFSCLVVMGCLFGFFFGCLLPKKNKEQKNQNSSFIDTKTKN